ncbi:MAG: hypothetical protein IPJ88_01165 [Myxococcales bacterium]|nr:MAG: hypothetical protein IPJ88_01165 [Myxococcales bacterium]
MFNYWGLALSLIALLGCSSDSSSAANISEYCNSICSKRSECDLLFGTTKSDCVDECISNSDSDNGGDSSCNPSQSQVDSCMSAISAADCDTVFTAPPAECENLCPDDNNTDAGTPAVDSGGTTISTTGDCSAPETCCQSITNPDIRPGCDESVADGNDELCAIALNGFYSFYCN